MFWTWKFSSTGQVQFCNLSSKADQKLHKLATCPAVDSNRTRKGSWILLYSWVWVMLNSNAQNWLSFLFGVVWPAVLLWVSEYCCFPRKSWLQIKGHIWSGNNADLNDHNNSYAWAAKRHFAGQGGLKISCFENADWAKIISWGAH